MAMCVGGNGSRSLLISGYLQRYIVGGVSFECSLEDGGFTFRLRVDVGPSPGRGLPIPTNHLALRLPSQSPSRSTFTFAIKLSTRSSAVCMWKRPKNSLPGWCGQAPYSQHHTIHKFQWDIAPARSRCSKLEVLNVRQPPICGRRNSSAVGSVHLHQSCGRCSRIPFRCEVPQVNSFGMTTCKKTGHPHQFRLHNC